MVPWSICSAIIYLVLDKEAVMISYRIGSIGWTVGIGCLFIFFIEMYYYISSKISNKRIYFLIIGIAILFWGAALFGQLVATDFEQGVWWGWKEIISPDYFWVILYLIFLNIASFISLFLIFKSLKNARFNKHVRQLKFIIIPFALIIIPSLITDLAAPLLNLGGIPPLAHLSITAGTLMIGTVLIKYRIADINPSIAASQILFDVSDYVFLTDMNGNISKLSNSAENILGYQINSHIKKNVKDFTPDFNLENIELKPGETGPACKTKILTQGNILLPVRCKITLVTDLHNDPVGYLFVMSDLRDMIAIEDLENAVAKRTNELELKNRLLSEEISEKKKIEEKMRLLANTIKSSKENICITDLEDKILFVNGSFCKVYGYDENEIVGKKASLLWSLKNGTEIEAGIYPETLKGGWEGELWNRRKDGTDFQIRLSTSVINDEAGLPVALVGISNDITEQKRIEEALRESEEKHRILLDESTDPVFSFSAERKYLYANRAFAEGVGKSVEQIVGYTIYDVFGKEEADKRVAALDHVIKTGTEKVIEVKVPRSDGDRYYITSITPVKNSKGEVNLVICSSKDITLRKKAEAEQTELLEELRTSRVWIEQEAIQLAILNEQLEESEAKLKELNAAKDKFFSIIAHDLKSPFLSLLGYCEILTNEFDALSDDEKKESIAGIYDLSNNSYKLLDNLLQWARIQIGKAEFNPELFNLLYELSPAILLYSQSAKHKNITIENCIERNTFIIADRNMLNTIIRNLISNSIKFCNRGGHIVISSIESDGFVEISVKDNGVGMDENQMNNLFSIDKNISTKGTANERGTGLGLLLSKEMIDKHGGKIWAHSEPGNGCEFRFTIPKI
ncbi:MAG: hypothetical protein C0412_04095 [Flavobacterium sp.]|nr:hypothetical protein [Flavobacterium sp.]